MARVKCPKCFTVNPDGQPRCVQCGAPLPRIKIAGPAPAPPAPPPPGQGPAATGQLNPGQTLAGRYTILQLIGRGGMGCIYRVRDNTLNEEVALKTLLPQFVRDKMVVERFFNEARIARKLAHPNIVRVHDIGAADGLVYISMELVRGRSLRNHMERLNPGDRLPPAEVLRVAEDLCVALEYAHQYTVHRDIKPENIMVDDKGVVKLMDFGISKLMANTRMTGASVVMGTPFYMSPEQLRNSRDVDARADIFSVGVVLYEILTGAVPTGVPKPPSVVVPTLPRHLDEIVSKCVDPDPGKRYQNAGELRAALRAIRQEMEQGPSAPAPKPRRSGPSLPEGLGGWVATLLCLALTGGALYAVELNRPDNADLSVAPSPAGNEGADMLALAARLRDSAAALSGVEAQPILADAERHWAAAEASGSPADAEAALRAYAAAHMAASLPDMAYIPGAPGGIPAFFMGRREVTQGEFAAFCRDHDWRSDYLATPGMESLPAANLAYYDAVAYAASKGMRLPSDAEWSRAAKLEDAARRYPWEGEF
ncbi:MAG: Serine/threonine-protein kinase StkP, partial [Candidatus Hydrogenedentota bacterium]